jgi:hypothetical protein
MKKNEFDYRLFSLDKIKIGEIMSFFYTING